MSPQPHGVITADQRDRAADDRDEAAWRRDRASAARDSEADERDERAETRMQSAMQYVRLARRLLDAAGQQVDTDQNVKRAQRLAESALARQGSRGELYARALSARAWSEALCEPKH